MLVHEPGFAFAVCPLWRWQIRSSYNSAEQRDRFHSRGGLLFHTNPSAIQTLSRQTLRHCEFPESATGHSLLFYRAAGHCEHLHHYKCHHCVGNLHYRTEYGENWVIHFNVTLASDGAFGQTGRGGVVEGERCWKCSLQHLLIRRGTECSMLSLFMRIDDVGSQPGEAERRNLTCAACFSCSICRISRPDANTRAGKFLSLAKPSIPSLMSTSPGPKSDGLPRHPDPVKCNAIYGGQECADVLQCNG